MTQTIMDTALYAGGVDNLAKARQVPGGASAGFCRSYGGPNWQALIPKGDYVSALEQALKLPIDDLFRQFDNEIFLKLWHEVIARESTPMLCVARLLLADRFDKFLLTRSQLEQNRVRFLLGLIDRDRDLQRFA